MENASKALIIAGSVLMAMMIIGAMVLMYNQISSIEQIKTENANIKKMQDYSKRFEEYNRTIYGSELFSLANLQEDYNKRFNEEDGYTAITINVNIKNSIPDSEYFKKGNSHLATILRYKNEIEKEIESCENEKFFKNKGKTIKYYSQLTIRELVDKLKDDQILDKEFDYNSSDTEDDIKNAIESAQNGKCKGLFKKIDEYKNLSTTYKEFKYKRFKCTKIELNNYNGRIEKMSFEEIER